MDEAAIVRALRAGDPAGAYDRYAAGLYDYAFSVLIDQHEAAYAVRDAVLVALDRAGHAPRGELRAWLYALVRNEALRRVRSRTHRPPHEATMNLGVDPLRELRDGPVRAAAGTLEASVREVLNLALRHDLDIAGVARVLGVDAGRTATRLDAALTQLEAAVTTISTLDDAEPAGVGAGGWQQEGGVPPRLSRRGARHRYDPRFQSGVAGRYAAVQQLKPPARLRTDVMSASREPGLVAYHGEFAGPYDRAGFPIPLDQPHRRRAAPAAAAAALAMLVLLGLGGTAVLVDGLRRDEAGTVVTVAPAATAGDTQAAPTESAARSSGRSSPRRKPAVRPPTRATSSSPPPSSPNSPSAPPSTPPSDPRLTGTGAVPAVAVDLVFTRSACPWSWHGTVTITVTGNYARTVTLYYDWLGTLTRSTRPAGDGSTYTATLTDLPGSRRVSYWAEVTTVDGKRATTQPRVIEKTCFG